MKKLVMFDMDGVLFNTMPCHAEAWTRTMHEIGRECSPYIVYLNEGRNGEGMIKELLGPGFDHVTLYERKCKHYDELPFGEVLPGAVEALRAVRDSGLASTIVTGSGQAQTLEHLKCVFAGLFREDWMVTGFDVKRGKPDPEPYLIGLRKAGITADEAIVVENAPLGIRSARAAGCQVLAVNTGPLEDSLLLNEGADELYHSMSELADALPALLESF